jgi:hypothetical protein
MDGLIEKMSSTQILAAIAILTGGLVALTMILSIARYQMRSLETDTALKREKHQGELALRTKLVEQGGANSEKALEALLTDTTPTPPPPPVGDLDVELATRFGVLDVPGAVIASTLELAVRSDPARKRSIIEVIDLLQMEDADHEAILAAVKPLCQPAEKTPVSLEM